MKAGSAGVAYCTNLLPGADLASALAELEGRAQRLRELVRPAGPLLLGLWLSARAATELDDPERVRRLRDRWLDRGLAVVGMNGFPYGDFHAARVKHSVYEPDWTQPARRDFTLRLARILVDLLPPDRRRASISTLPIGWRANLGLDSCGGAIALAAAQLERMAEDLARIESKRGVRISLDLEPEPGCLLDRPRHVVELFGLASLDRWRRHLGVCHDVCHAAVMFDGQGEALGAYRRAGIRVGKVQVSSALACDGSPAAVAALGRFDEPRYLHQTCVLEGDEVRLYEDLPEALPRLCGHRSRTHFHVPIHLDRIGPLETTRDEIDACLAALTPDDPSDDPPDLEIETYAWDVLPSELKPQDLAEGMATEIRWLSGRMRR